MIGYDKGENGEWIINEEQAEPVRYLFRRYACGAGRATIIKRKVKHLCDISVLASSENFMLTKVMSNC